MIKQVLDETKEKMNKTIAATKSEFAKIRTGRANLSLLDTVRVDYYGSMVPLKQVANMGIPEPRLITVQPWDKNMIGAIEKAIMQADIGITPNSDGHIIRLPIPPLTEERRKELVKLVHQLGEEGKIAIRNIRRDALERFKKAKKNNEISEDEEYNGGIDVQSLTDEFIKKVDEIISSKEEEIMEI